MRRPAGPGSKRENGRAEQDGEEDVEEGGAETRTETDAVGEHVVVICFGQSRGTNR